MYEVVQLPRRQESALNKLIKFLLPSDPRKILLINSYSLIICYCFCSAPFESNTITTIREYCRSWILTALQIKLIAKQEKLMHMRGLLKYFYVHWLGEFVGLSVFLNGVYAIWKDERQKIYNYSFVLSYVNIHMDRCWHNYPFNIYYTCLIKVY